LGGTLSGNKLGTRNTQIQVEKVMAGVDATQLMFIAGHQVELTLHGKDVNHDSLPFFVSNYAISALKK